MSGAAVALENGVEAAPLFSANNTSAAAPPHPSNGVEMQPLPDMPASAPFWYQVPPIICRAHVQVAELSWYTLSQRAS